MRRLQVRNPNARRSYRQLWRVVDGAVADVFNTHPDYLRTLSPRRALHIRSSLVKRITGALHGYAVKAAKGRSGARPAADTKGGEPSSPFTARLLVWARHLFTRGGA